MLRLPILIWLITTFQIVNGQVTLVFDSTNFKDGTGTLAIKDSKGNDFGFLSFKNHHMDGEYFSIDTSRIFSITGTVKYSPGCIQTKIGYEVTYVTTANDTLSAVYDSSSLETFYRVAPIRIINIDRIPVEITMTLVHPDLRFSFGDPAVVPIGKWEYRDVRNKYVFKEYYFDNCGNIVAMKLFDYQGNLIHKVRYIQTRHNKINWK